MNKNKGFSIIEIAIVVGVVVIISALALTNFGGRRNTADLNATTQQIAALLREAQSRAMSQTGGQTWGVHFENAATPFYALFSGSTYSTSTTVGYHKLPTDVCYSNISSGSSQEVIFAQISGQPASSTTVQLQLTPGCSTVLGGTGGGSGPAIGSWANTTALPTTISNHSAVINNGYIYTTGGHVPSGGAATSTIFFAPISDSGTIGSWATTTALPTDIYYHTAVASNGHIYRVGGVKVGEAPTSSVLYASISGSGTIGSWATTTAMSGARYTHVPLVYNGYVYVVGGYTTSAGNSGTSSVIYATINPNGTIASWANTTAMPTDRTDYAAAVSNGYMYVIGGIVNAGAAVTSSVIYAPISGSGTIGSWATTTALPDNLSYSSAVASNGYIYTIGGNAAGITSTVLYAKVNGDDGTIGSWTTTTALPSALYDNPTAVVSNGYIYTTGGKDSGGNLTSTVFYAPLLNGSVMATSTITVSAQGQISF